ncbi:MAG: hypothetical protein NTX25_12380 [Proteobacteria bacterium]|nr:hypothetical protein [Pseudomonadota bacterium]
MATWQYTVHLLPVEYVKSNAGINSDFIDNFPGWEGVTLSMLSENLNQMFGSVEVLPGFRFFGNSDKYCVSILLGSDDNTVQEISARYDLRSPIHSQIESIFEFARSLNAVLVTEDFKVVAPNDFEAIRNALRASNASKFVADPSAYFEALSGKESN